MTDEEFWKSVFLLILPKTFEWRHLNADGEMSVGTPEECIVSACNYATAAVFSLRDFRDRTDR